MKIKSICTIAILGLLTSACQRDKVHEPETPILDITIPQGGVVEFTNEASEASITVNTTSDEWGAAAADSWLTVTPQKGTLLLKAESNVDPTERQTTVEVFTSNIKKSFIVTQKSSPLSLSLGLTPKAIDQWGGDICIDINSNVDTWSATSDVEWLTLKRDLSQQQLVISVEENTAREKRQATIQVRVSDESDPLSFEVVQNGIIYWVLPIIEPGLKPEQVEELESTRRHTLQGIPNRYAPEKIYKYSTVSPVIPRIEYSFNKQEDYIHTRAILQNANVVSGEEYNAFAEFMRANGFSEDSTNLFVHEGYNTEAELLLGNSEKFILYTYYPEEENPQATVTHFPFTSSLSFYTSRLPAITTYQTSIGGILDNNWSTTSRKVFRHSATGESKSYTYAYNFSWSSFNQLQFVDPNIFRYIYFGDNNMIHFTKAFRTMLRKHGYAFRSRDAYSQLKYVFRNAKRNVEVTIELGVNAFPDKDETGGYAIIMTFKPSYS